MHLETEIEWRDRDIQELQDKVAQRESLTVSELIEELLHENRRLDFRSKQSDDARRKAEEDNRRTQDKMKVWRAISTDVS